MSPILVRPVREQFEHDRVIRALQARYNRKFEVAMNPGAEQNAAVDIGELPMYPDLLLYSKERGRKLQGTIEVETTESINTLEAMAEWAPFSRLRAPFFLFVPPNSIDSVRRLCAEHQVIAAEIWTYHTAVDQVRFTMVHHEPEDAPRGRTTAPKPEQQAAQQAEQKAASSGTDSAIKTPVPRRPAAARKPSAGAKQRPGTPAATRSIKTVAGKAAARTVSARKTSKAAKAAKTTTRAPAKKSAKAAKSSKRR